MLALKLIFFAYLIMSFLQMLEGKQVLRIDRFAMTNISEDSPVKWDYFKINFTEQTGSFISADGYLTRDITGDKLHLDISITRCANRESLDTCENFKNLKPSNFCHFMNMKGVAWTSFVYSYTPPFKCPFKKGRYVQKDGMFDPSTFNFFPITDYYWKIRAKFYDANEFLFETYTELRVVPVS